MMWQLMRLYQWLKDDEPQLLDPLTALPDA